MDDAATICRRLRGLDEAAFAAAYDELSGPEREAVAFEACVQDDESLLLRVAETALVVAATEGKLWALELILASGAASADDIDEAHEAAAESGHEDAAELLGRAKEASDDR